MKESISIRSILNQLFLDGVSDGGTGGSQKNSVDLSEAQLFELLESKAETFNQVEYFKSGSVVKTDVQAIPLSALNELRGK
jgi:hypothetical protein